MSTKLQEAQEHVKAAEKALKTSVFRWSPDYDTAADEYNQAAQCFRIARDLKSSLQYHIKASEMYARNNSFFHAGKALETALLVGKEISAPETLYKLSYDASMLYQQQGSGDSGAGVLEKGAKILEPSRPDLAVKLYQRAADVSSSESSQHQGAEYMSKASRLHVKLQQYDEAVDSIRREIAYHQEADNVGAVGRLVVAMVLVQFARGDTVAAEKAYKEWGNSCEASEMNTIDMLLQAFDEEDRDLAIRALHSPFLRSMDVEYSRLASTIALPEEGAVHAPRSVVRENAAPSYVSAGNFALGEASSGYAIQSRDSIDESARAGVADNDDDEEEHLC